MSVYTVHEPPLRPGEASADPDRVTFVRDGFHFWAFLLGPVWMLWRRLWVVCLLYLVVVALVQAGLWLAHANTLAQVIVATLIALLVGFEAATLRRWTLRRRGWKNVAVVVGDDLESAERRFFSTWAPRARPSSTTPSPSLAMRAGRDPAPDVLGLFPEPGSRQ